MSDMTFAVTRIIITLLAALVSSYIVPYLKSLSENERSKQVIDTIKASVYAAEQTVKGSGKGTEKKAQVLQEITKWLNDHGMIITSDQIDTLIEAAVYELKRGDHL